MSTTDDFKNSQAWDSRYNLPLVPRHNNPWLYCAYAVMCGCEIDPYVLGDHYYKCLAKSTSGLINRWPDGSGGLTSHDELIGASFLSLGIAHFIYEHLTRNCFFYNNTPEKATLRHWLGRLYWLGPYIRACAGDNLGFFEKMRLKIFLFLDRFTRDYGGTIRNALIVRTVEHIIPESCKKWREAKIKNGLTPDVCFSNYLVEIAMNDGSAPVFLKNAPKEW